MRKSSCLAALMAVALVSSTLANPPARFRDFQIYTTSASDSADASRIVATMQLLNRGATQLEVHLTLAASEAAGFAGKKFDGRIEPGKETAVTFDIKPPPDLKRAVFTGSIAFGDANAPVDRELYVAVQGPDPANFNNSREERITAKAQVVGTFAPRTPESIQRLIQQLSLQKPPGGAALVVAGAGKSDYRIALSPANAELTDAVADLQHVVKSATDATLPISSDGTGPAIYVRQIAAPSDRHPDSYHLYTKGADIIIEATTPDGLRHGVYGLLTDHLDSHWFMPKKLGEEFQSPADRTLRLRAMDETRSPSFYSSAGMSWGSARRWDYQNRSFINRGRMNFGHAWAGFIDRAKYPFDKFPDMWSRDRSGKVQVFDNDYSATNFCSTNPDVIKIVAEKINAQFDASPDAIVASLDPNDYSPMCQCDRCLALDKSFGVTPTDNKQMADRLMVFSKEIHDRLKPEHQKKYLGILAYGFQTRPPKGATPNPFHVSEVCDFPGYADHSRPFNDPTSAPNRDFYGIVKGWASKVKQLGFYDYYGHYNFFGPWGILHKMREDLPAFREMGGTFVVIESQPNFGMHGLNLYIAGRLAWDIDADVDVLVDEYIKKFYGPAAGPMGEFFRSAERHYALTRPGTETALRVGASSEFWKELDGYLMQAEQVAKGLGEGDKRFFDRVTLARDGFTFGKLYSEIGPRANDAAYLQKCKAEFDRMKVKYSPTDEYWPTVLATYFWPDVDAMLKQAH